MVTVLSDLFTEADSGVCCLGVCDNDCPSLTPCCISNCFEGCPSGYSCCCENEAAVAAGKNQTKCICSNVLMFSYTPSLNLSESEHDINTFLLVQRKDRKNQNRPDV